MTELQLPDTSQLFEAHIYNPEDRGWHFGAGNPEWWAFRDDLLVTGGKLLDVGIGYGRSSFFFAVNGMEVVGYDFDDEPLQAIEQMQSELAGQINLNYDLRREDFLKSDYDDTGAYDTVILDHTLNHLEDKETAFALLDKAFKALRPGGRIFIRGNGIDDSRYWDMIDDAKRGYRHHGFMQYIPVDIEVVDKGVLREKQLVHNEEHSHGHSINGIEMSLYFDQLELQTWLADQDSVLEYSRCIPIEETHNMMFGENFNPRRAPPYVGGTITLIARRKK